MNLSETKSLLALIAAAYPEQFHFHEAMPALWEECLNDIDGNEAAQALKTHIKTNVWPPKISEIREAVFAFRRAEREREAQKVKDAPRLPAPPVHVITDEERARNRQKVKELCEKIAKDRAARIDREIENRTREERMRRELKRRDTLRQQLEESEDLKSKEG